MTGVPRLLRSDGDPAVLATAVLSLRRNGGVLALVAPQEESLLRCVLPDAWPAALAALEPALVLGTVVLIAGFVLVLNLVADQIGTCGKRLTEFNEWRPAFLKGSGKSRSSRRKRSRRTHEAYEPADRSCYDIGKAQTLDRPKGVVARENGRYDAEPD